MAAAQALWEAGCTMQAKGGEPLRLLNLMGTGGCPRPSAAGKYFIPSHLASGSLCPQHCQEVCSVGWAEGEEGTDGDQEARRGSMEVEV